GGNAGNIALEGNAIRLIDSRVGSSTTSPVGVPGDVSVRSKTLDVIDSQIGGGAHIAVVADRISLDGGTIETGGITVITPELVVTRGGSISNDAEGDAPAGNILILARADGAGALSITGDRTGGISSSSVPIDIIGS